VNSTFSHDLFLSFSRIIRSTYDCTCMSHCTSCWSCNSCNESYNWLLLPSALIQCAASASSCPPISPDHTIHSVSGSFNQFNCFFSCSSNNWISTTNSCKILTLFNNLVSSFVS
jgi:hypothetical protein